MLKPKALVLSGQCRVLFCCTFPTPREMVPCTSSHLLPREGRSMLSEPYPLPLKRRRVECQRQEVHDWGSAAPRVPLHDLLSAGLSGKGLLGVFSHGS
jgi:hypothetical protein